MPSPEGVLQLIRPRVEPNKVDREKMTRIADALRQDVERILTVSAIQGSVTLQGSFARDTWVKDDADLDIFARFPKSMERREWIDNVLPTVRKGLSRFRVIERYAEHPFLEFHYDGVRVNIVPCYDVEKGDWKSATDRTPYHTEFMRSNLKAQLRLEARFLKKFAKGIGVYGAEIKTGGFSGMLIDTLTLYYHSFLETIRHASSWTPGTRLEIGKPPDIMDAKKREQGVDLVVIDPVDPNRNLAAAVRSDKLWSLVAAGREFLQHPATRFFFPLEFTKRKRSQFARRIEQSDRELIAVEFKHPALVPDVLWGQLMRLEKSLVEMLTREDFRVYRSRIWSDEKTKSAFILELDQVVLSNARIQKGPPVSKQDDSNAYLERHTGAGDTVRGPWIEADRWMVEKKRRVTTIQSLVKASIRQESYGLTVPRQVGASFSRTCRVLQGQAILLLLGKTGFDEVLWKFLDAKPSWLKPSKT